MRVTVVATISSTASSSVSLLAKICHHLITLSHLPGQCQMFLDCHHPHLPKCPLAGSPYSQALSLTPLLLSSATSTTDSRINLTYVSCSSSVNVKAISTKVPVIHPTIWDYKSNTLHLGHPHVSAVDSTNMPL